MENRESPFFSVIIPVYNAEGLIGDCLDGLSKQTFQAFEIIIVNDGSTDASLQQIEDYLLKASLNCRIFTQANSGAGAARNVGLRQAVGEYIVFLDADDHMDESFLEETKNVIDDAGVDVVYVDHVRERKDGTVIRHEKMSRFRDLDKDRFIRWQLTGKIPWGGGRKVVKRTLLTENDVYFATTIRVGEESLYTYKLTCLAQKHAFQTKALYHYVENANGLTAKDTVSNSVNVYEFLKKSFNDGEIDQKYADTLGAMAITTMVIAINVLSQQYGVFEARKRAKELLKKYAADRRGRIDADALESRVKLCAPFIKLGWAFPVVMAGKVKKWIDKK